jgi:hypothetical protein
LAPREIFSQKDVKRVAIGFERVTIGTLIETRSQQEAEKKIGRSESSEKSPDRPESATTGEGCRVSGIIPSAASFRKIAPRLKPVMAERESALLA